MNWEHAPLLIILVISVLGDNHSVSIAALLLLLVKLLGFDNWFPVLESHGLSVGITILTIAILVPVAQGNISLAGMAASFTTPITLIAIAIGVFVSWVAGQGVPFMKESPEAVTALVLGTIVGVCFFKGLAVGPLIAGGLVSLVVHVLGRFS